MPYDYDYFISYAHKDNVSKDGKPGFVDEFVEKLQNSPEHQQLFGNTVSVFFDKSTIENMVQWDAKIRAGLASSRFLIVLLSPNYFKSEYCAREFYWWMQHEMHRCTLGEGTAPMLIVDVASLQDPDAETIPDIPSDLQIRYPNWLKQIRKIQSDFRFDMHDLLVSKIDDVLNALRDGVKDKVRHQETVDHLSYDPDYPGYNENFVGRRENLLALRKRMSEKSGKKHCALTGIGGFGKTELALTYGHAFGWDYELGRFFEKCENMTSLTDVLLSCGVWKKFNWEPPKKEPEEQLRFLFDCLKEEQDKIIRRNVETGNLKTEGAHMLLILDNVNCLELISRAALSKLPDYIHIVITTRENTNEFKYINTESVERLSEDESVELLNNLRLFDTPEETQAARDIAKLLAGFTLVVELTGAYLARNEDVTYQKQYEKLFRNHAETFKLMAEKIGDLTQHAAETVAAVMESTLSALSDNARKALEFAALMSPEAVARGWLPELCKLNENDGLKVLGELKGYSLVTPLKGEPNIGRIHRLVAETIKKEIPEEVQKGMIAVIRYKCNELLHNDKTFWCTPENSWNIVPISEFCLALADNWTVEASEEEIDWNLTWMLGTAGDMLNSLGKMNEARETRKRCFEISKERVDAFPSNTDAQRELSVSYNRLGDLEKAAGNAAAAREWYEKALEIYERLAKAMPENVDAQRNLSISYECLGDLEKAAGNAAAARVWYEKALEIRKRLAEQMKDDVQAQRDLSVSYERLGDLEQAAGNAAAARAWYEKALEIRKRLAEQMKVDVQAQWDLSISYIKLGYLEGTVGNTDVARELFEKALKIHQRLVEIMPENVQIQKELGIILQILKEL